MGKIQIVLPKTVEDDFRQKAAERIGNKKGNISIAATEAFLDWIRKK